MAREYLKFVNFLWSSIPLHKSLGLIRTLLWQRKQFWRKELVLWLQNTLLSTYKDSVTLSKARCYNANLFVLSRCLVIRRAKIWVSVHMSALRWFGVHSYPCAPDMSEAGWGSSHLFWESFIPSYEVMTDNTLEVGLWFGYNFF